MYLLELKKKRSHCTWMLTILVFQNFTHYSFILLALDFYRIRKAFQKQRSLFFKPLISFVVVPHYIAVVQEPQRTLRIEGAKTFGGGGLNMIKIKSRTTFCLRFKYILEIIGGLKRPQVPASTVCGTTQNSKNHIHYVFIYKGK